MIVFAVLLTAWLVSRRVKVSPARQEQIGRRVEQRIQATVQAVQQEEVERNSGGWRPPSGSAAAPTPNIAPRIQATEVAPPLQPSPVMPEPLQPSPVTAEPLQPSPVTAELPGEAARPAALHSAPQQLELPAELRARALELMEQNYEVGAVRLVCDEMGVGILDAQKTVRTLAGLPTL